jgi:hypothetical protein
MIYILSIVLSVIFLTLSAIHIHWALGGKWGFKNAIPTKENGDLVMKPRTMDSIMVAVYLGLFAFFYATKTNICSVSLPEWTTYFLWIIPTLFLLRAIGEFKYVGFFRKVNSTVFSKWDKKLFSPLCLAISVIGFCIVLFN